MTRPDRLSTPNGIASRDSTTILGTIYAGRPMFGSLAFALWKYEQMGRADDARDLLAAHNHIRACFGQEPIDLARQFTADPTSMACTVPAALAFVEAQAGFTPGIVERPIDRVVTRTVRRAA